MGLTIPEQSAVFYHEVTGPNASVKLISLSGRAGSRNRGRWYFLLLVDELVVEFGGLEVENLIEIEMRMLGNEVLKASGQSGFQLGFGGLFGRKVLLGGRGLHNV